MYTFTRAVTVLTAAAALGGAAMAQETAPVVKPEKIVPMDTPIKSTKNEVTLKVGDAAPPLKVDSFLKGEPISAFKPGHVYVVEFWATWCGPCIKNIPHLTEVQKQYKGKVTVLGVAASERAPKQNESDNRESNLKKFVREQGKKMDYTVAYDSQRAMSATWMKPAGQDTIPTAFVVDGEGKIAYIGHPSGMDEVLSTLAGTPEKGKKDTGKKKSKAPEPATEPKSDPKADPSKAPTTEPTTPEKKPG